VSEVVRAADVNAGQTPDEGGAEERRAARFSVLIRPAKLVCGPFEYPCVMRDVSETGVSVRLFQPLPRESDIKLEMLGGDSYPLELVWEEGLAAGFRFRAPVDVQQILANAGPFANRPVRLTIDMPVVLQHGARKTSISLINISQQGARLSCSEYLALGQLVVLQSECLPRVHAKVRWRKNDEYGVVFEETFKLNELAELAARIYASAGFAGAHPSGARSASAASRR
jgi:hypothetical protein